MPVLLRLVWLLPDMGIMDIVYSPALVPVVPLWLPPALISGANSTANLVSVSE